MLEKELINKYGNILTVDLVDILNQIDDIDKTIESTMSRFNEFRNEQLALIEQDRAVLRELGYGAFKKYRNSEKFKELEEKVRIARERKNEEAVNGNLLEKVLKLYYKRMFLQDNGREVLRKNLSFAARDILKEYIGKKYGPKTREKINNSAFEKINTYMWILEDYRISFHSGYHATLLLELEKYLCLDNIRGRFYDMQSVDLYFDGNSVLDIDNKICFNPSDEEFKSKLCDVEEKSAEASEAALFILKEYKRIKYSLNLSEKQDLESCLCFWDKGSLLCFKIANYFGFEID